MGKERHAVDSDDCSSDTEKADEVEEEEPSEVDSEEEPDEEDPFEEEPDEEDPCEEEPDEEDPCEEEPSEEGSCEEEPDEDPYDESNIESLHGQETNEVPCEEEPNRQASCEEEVIEGHSCESSREDETNEEPFEEDRREEQYEIEQPEDSEPDEEEFEEQCEEEPSEEPSEEEPNGPGEPSGDDRYTSQSNPEKRNMSTDAISGPKVSIGSLSINFLETPQNMSNNVMAPGKLDNAKDSGRKRRSRWDVEAGSNGTADGSIDVAKKERKSRWSSDDSQLNSTAVVSDHDVVFYQEVVKLHAQLFEITQKLQAREVVDERPDGERSPSPPPLYNDLGMKINSREIRLRETLNLQRQMIISELIQKNPSYIPPPDWKNPNRSNNPTLTPIPKFCKKLYIPSKEYPEYNFAGLIIGPRGNTQKRMEKETGAKICLRGKGSVVEGKHKISKSYDNDDDLHVLVEAGSKGSLDAAVAMVEKLLIPVEDGRNVHKLAQLQELATLNGTLRNKKLCDVCGDATHSTSACPLTASDPGANTNDHEVNYLSELRGAFSAFSAPALPSSYKLSVASTASVSSKPEKETDYTNLYVGHLPHSVDDKKLVELFSPFGQICESQVIRDKNTGLSRCYGFVKYVDHINATTAVTQMNGYKIDGQMLVVRAAGILLSPDKPKTGTGGFPSLHQLPQYPGYAAIAHSNPGPMCWPGPPRPVLPEPGASFVKNGSNSVYRYPFHGQSSVSLGPFCQPPPPSTLLSRDVAASDELANFPGYLKSLGPPSQLLQASQTSLPSSQVHFTPNFSHPYMPPP
ncbi:branchpoint-bridging protein-like [Iris pallida]|uniref:Branchpoint-bridging protein n=1 Tax=Iris pallida TaxID=29817 RepID=A0AAX6H7E5_IRIPA|nr:branchpoint-bridging protein-like [Iris pallida]